MGEDSMRTLALMNETGYSIQQDNGQRIFGPPPKWTAPAPKDTEVFIGKLPNDIYEYDLVPLFSSVGKIYMLRIMQNFSGLNRGFAFVQYTTPEEADKAIRYLNNIEIRPGEKIGVVKSRNNCRLYIGRLDTTMTKEDIREELEKYTEDIVDVVIHKSDIPGHYNRGYAFVEYQSHKAAAKARRKIVPCKIKIRGVEVTVDWATPINESGDNINVMNSILIRNLRKKVENDELWHFISLRNNFKITKFKRLPNQLLISFSSRQEAEFAMRILNELKDTKQFCYFEENDQRIEILWLKNNTDLSAFSSAINYVPAKNFNFIQRNCCDPSYHQHSNLTLNAQSQQLINRINHNNKHHQQSNNIKQQCINNNIKFPVIKNLKFFNNRCGKPLMPLNNNLIMNKNLNDMNGSMNMQIPNQRFIPNFNNYQTTMNSELNNIKNSYSMNGNDNINNLTNRMQITNHTNTFVNGLSNMNSGYDYRLNNRLTNLFSNNLDNSSTLTNHQINNQTMNRSQSIVQQSLTQNNPFSHNQFSLDNAWKNGLSLNNSYVNNDLTNGLTNLNLNNFANQSSSNLIMTKNQGLNPLVNSLNTSYNFGVWANYNTNLDASADWTRVKYDRKLPITKNLAAKANLFESQLMNQSSLISKECPSPTKSNNEVFKNGNDFNFFDHLNENLPDFSTPQ